MNNNNPNGATLTKYLSPVAVWALAFGCAVGWGAFVMPGTTFLPLAGPLGSVLGLIIGAGIMLIIGYNYHVLMKRYPDAGGSYSYASKTLGSDHGFLCAWMLLLTYSAIIWANSTALSLIVRYLFGNVLSFGFSYEIAGYKVYPAEVALSVAAPVLACAVCLLGKKLTKIVQTAAAAALFIGIAVCFTSVVIHRGGFSGLAPAFAAGNGSGGAQVIGIVILAPWAFIGFESISHSAEEFRFSAKKSLPIMATALVTAALAYIMLVICAALALPDGYSNWAEYISRAASLDGIKALPTFFAAQDAMGAAGPVILGIAAFCGIFTGLIANLTALGRLLFTMSRDEIITKRLGRLSKRNVPKIAIMATAGVSVIMPFFGRTAIGWIVDVTTIGATLVYFYTSLSAFKEGRNTGSAKVRFGGICGMVFSLIFAAAYMLPIFSSRSRLSTESYLILILWSLLGMIVFRLLVHRDKKRRLGKSIIVWVILLMLILLVSAVWLHQLTADQAAEIAGDINAFQRMTSTQAGLSPDSRAVIANESFVNEQMDEFCRKIMLNILVLIALIGASLAVVFSIFSVIKKREKQIESERLIAEESSKAKSAFLSNMSHDIRTPMNAISGYTALALKEDISPKLRGYLEKIDISSSHLLSLVNDILDMSRIESGKMELSPSPADLIELAEETESIFTVNAEQKQLSFRVDCSGVRDRYVVCDRNRVQRILLNLLSNACKFTNPGGSVSLTVRQNLGDEYEFRCADTGIGMSKEFAERIFEAFERERTDAVNHIQGTGLGMTITKGFVDLMGGSIKVNTEQGKGTEFIIRVNLPKAEESDVHTKLSDAKDSTPAQQHEGVKILLVEDNPINLEIATMILTREGYEVDRAENGQIAVEKVTNAAEHEYDVILMDVQMPVMNGYEAARAIRALSGSKSKLPIVALTANTFEEDRRNALDAGMNAFVSKPFKPEELVETIDSLNDSSNN